MKCVKGPEGVPIGADVPRLPRDEHACPRCGEPVRYGGRGRRPVWCSPRCRVEASIERRGNRIVGVQPVVVKIIDKTLPRPRPAPQPIEQDGRRKRPEDWAADLEDLRRALASGAVYDRELAELAAAIRPVLDAYDRRTLRR
jgi:hypothetical protein